MLIKYIQAFTGEFFSVFSYTHSNTNKYTLKQDAFMSATHTPFSLEQYQHALPSGYSNNIVTVLSTVPKHSTALCNR